MVNKKGWIRILEAFMGVLLIAAVLTIILENNDVFDNEKVEKIFGEEVAVLKYIQLNNSLREDIMAVDIPVNSTQNNFPSKVLNAINEKKPSYLDCVAKICNLDSECFLENDLESEDIYVKNIPIFCDLKKYEPRQLKLFCVEK